MERPEIRAVAVAAAAAGALAMSRAEAFTAIRSPSISHGRSSAEPAPRAEASPRALQRWGLALAGMATAGAGLRKARRKLQRRAVPETLDFLQQVHAQAWDHGNANPNDFLEQVQQFWQHAHGNSVPAADLAAALQQWADSLSEGAGKLAHEIVPPAYAAEVELDPNTTYLYGSDGAVLVDPMNNKPITDDWWNGFIGFQAGLIKGMDQLLRDNGVEQAFGWTIVLYTAFIKLLFFPLTQGQLKSTSMMQLLSPKVKEIQEKYKDDPEAQQRLLQQLYSVMDVNPLGGCLPVLLQLPIFWSLYGVWRRLAAEKFPHYTEGWLWVPSLAQPNPDFQFKFDWLLQWKDGAPEMGWSDYLAYL
ncbi:unnamed protein product, partial [Durusdinium trenchii]